MEEIFSLIIRFFLHQILTLYVGAFVLSIFYKLIGKKLTYRDIVKRINDGNSELHYLAFYVGVIFFLIFVFYLSWFFDSGIFFYNSSNPK